MFLNKKQILWTLALETLFAIFFTTSLLANKNGTPTNHSNLQEEEQELGRVVVTADRMEKSTYKSRLTTSVVDSEDIEENSYSDLPAILESTPGLSRVYDYHSPFMLRGTSGTKMLILRNGNPVFSSFPTGFMGQGVNIYDMDRVEIVRGPGSVIYGAGATSGVINIIDKDPFKEERNLAVKLGAIYGTNANDRTIMGGGNFLSPNFALRITGRYRKADEYHYPERKKAVNSDLQDKDVSLNGGIKLGEKNKLFTRLALHRGGPWGKPYMFSNKKYIIARQEDDNLLDLSVKYEGKDMAALDSINVSLFYARETRKYRKQVRNSKLTMINSEDIIDLKNISFGANTLATIRFGINQLSFGGDSYSVKLWSPVESRDYYNDMYSKKKGARGAGITTGGIYVRDNIRLSPNFTLTTGARFDIASIVQGKTPTGDKGASESRKAMSGNVGLVFNPVKTQAISLNFGRAFRMPGAASMFHEQIRCTGTIVPNRELQPEYSWNLDGGYRGEMKGFAWDLALFLNQYTDLLLIGPNPQDKTEQMVMNESSARIYGGEVELTYRARDVFFKGLQVNPGIMAAYCLGSSFEKSGEQWNMVKGGENLAGIPPANIKTYIKFMHLHSAKMSSFLRVEVDTWLGKTRMPGELSKEPWNNEDVAGYALLNISMGMTFYNPLNMEKIKFNISGQNILDRKYYHFGSYIPGKGRDIRIFANIEI